MKSYTQKQIKKSLEFLDNSQIMLIMSGENFIALYKDTLVPSFYGSYSKTAMFIYSCGRCREMYESQLQDMLPDLTIICME